MQYIFGKVICNVINYVLKVMFNSMSMTCTPMINNCAIYQGTVTSHSRKYK